ncbi:MAG: hypothetical protein WC783_00750 [Candidatus Paceibacterota bacterium]|jgi:hypothetical protein
MFWNKKKDNGNNGNGNGNGNDKKDKESDYTVESAIVSQNLITTFKSVQKQIVMHLEEVAKD